MTETPRPGRLIVLSGPSGVGKDTVLNRVFELDDRLRYSISFTTRPPRPGEVDGSSYSFVDEPTFAAMQARGEFLETAVVHGNRYGTSRQRVMEALRRGDDIVLKIDVQGAGQLRDRVQDALFIFLLPPSEDELQTRLQGRGTDDAHAVARRAADARRELAEAERYDHRVVNDDVERAAREIVKLVADTRGDNGRTRGDPGADARG
jgi:guanylate kinase